MPCLKLRFMALNPHRLYPALVKRSELEIAKADATTLGRIRLAASAGELSEADLRVLNAWLAPYEPARVPRHESSAIKESRHHD
ncbi:MAG: hypothetical protein JO370_15820 [Paucibacter sp.]|nr:hypothetical protein [Roseateles sp.]